MRELEFLPEWYPKIRCRKRMVMLQTWITMILVAGLGLWMFMAQRNVRSAEGSLSVLSRELVETEQELRKLDDLIGLQRQMQAQDRVQTKLGMHVPVTKLMNALETAMPTEMAVVEFALDTEELARRATASGFGNARDRKAAPVDDDRPPARRL
ncbi:MAG: hypothetical protein ACREIT_10165, partial [Tepidisphaeraceae bacterium]